MHMEILIQVRGMKLINSNLKVKSETNAPVKWAENIEKKVKVVI